MCGLITLYSHKSLGSPRPESTDIALRSNSWAATDTDVIVDGREYPMSQVRHLDWGAPEFICPECSGEFDNAAGLAGHRSSKHGVRAKTSSIQSLDHTALARAAKATGQYLNSILAKIEAPAKGKKK